MGKYLYRLTADDYAFNGFRLSITRKKKSFARYFSDLEYGGSERAYLAALAVRNAMLAELEANPDGPEEVFARYRKTKASHLPGLCGAPASLPGSGAGPASCTLRHKGRSSEIHARLCRRLGIGRASVLRLALYSLMADLGNEECAGLDAEGVAAWLESRRAEGDPDWQEYMGGESGGRPAEAEQGKAAGVGAGGKPKCA